MPPVCAERRCGHDRQAISKPISAQRNGRKESHPSGPQGGIVRGERTATAGTQATGTLGSLRVRVVVSALQSSAALRCRKCDCDAGPRLAAQTDSLVLEMACRSAVNVVVAALGPLVQACASPGQLVTQTLRVETPGCAQVACELSNDRGSWILSPTPGNVTLTTSHVPLKVRCCAEDDVGGGAATPSSLASTTAQRP